MIKQKTQMKMSIALLCWTIALTITILSIANVSSLVFVNSVSQDALYPGQEASIKIEISNDFDYDVKDVSLTLFYNPTQTTNTAILFTPVGSSTDSVDEINEDDEETFSFKIKAGNSIEPGDYVLPYLLTYENQSRTGSIGIKVNSKTALDFSLNQEKKVIGMQDKVTFKIYNKGYGEVKFVIVDAEFTGATLLSEEKVYIGSVSSDDFETATFDVLINKANPTASFTVNYKDFENNDKKEVINLDLTAYTREEALKLGIIQKNNTPLIIGLIVVLILTWWVFRAVKKARAKRTKLKNKGN